MIRIILPLAVIATLLFAPIFGETTEVGGVDKDVALTGYDYISGTIECWKNGEFSLRGDCRPTGGNLGVAIFAAVFVSAVAAALGVIGLLPLIGRLTSFITTAAGVIVLAAIGFYALTQMSGDNGDQLRWGAYLAGGGGLLTLISGLAGMRGR